MLKHEQPEERMAGQAAAQVRVTPEELAAAIARLEARRTGADGKIAIGDAVSELSLDATPEEVLAEVRAGQSQPQAVKPRRPLSLGQRLSICFAAGVVLLSIMQLIRARSGVSYTPQHIFLAPDILVGNPSGRMVLLSEVGDGQPVRCRYGGISFQQFNPGQQTRWTLIKHDGRPYVRGWILRMSPAVLAQNGAEVNAVRDSNYTVPITLPVSGFDVTVPIGGNGANWDDSPIFAQNIHLDKHAYERW